MGFSKFLETAPADLLPSYDYIIIGGGTAGCVLANRLSQDATVSVLLIERGGVKNTFVSRIPLLSSHFASDGSRSKVLLSAPQKHLDGRQLEIIAGNSLGGASKINAMMYTRGLPAEYKLWKGMGNEGWGYQDLLPYFLKGEKFLNASTANDSACHNAKGKIIKACSSMGVPYVDDLNAIDASPHGCTKMYWTIDNWGRRSSTLTAFLPLHVVHERKDRLHVCTNTVVRRIDIQNSTDGLVAEGVWITSAAQGKARLVKARREVVLSAGAIFSPHVLMLSGIGPAGHLREHGITPVKDLPAVGGNLQDHVSVAVQFQNPIWDSLAMLVLRPWIIIKLLILFVLFGTGLLLSPVLELPIFLQSRLLNKKHETVVAGPDDLDNTKTANIPDIEIMPVDVPGNRTGGLSFLSIPLRPSSRGTVRLASADPLRPPLVDLNAMATAHDRAVVRTALRFSLALKARIAAFGYPIFDSLQPQNGGGASDADLDAYVREQTKSAFHYSSTCRMGREDGEGWPDDAEAGGVPGGVVDSRLRVHGVRGLRVADASVMPRILSAHLVAGTVAIAEKCAAMVEEEWSAKLRENEDEE
ncbi:hypothetical protein PHLGIDRAFT_30130 [Phlebiopsis gigantea 11061_1 CR5-6]|uniref:Glucose-methanol-choline oxidoreductase N-terminal domain-containing protein n=1 Tax=Phlebiopsis gigantea (strain 11061_1 CR5-6) TaxID=745531 RepID=A0A0C3SAM1_PHLG1|nr:hypothetical protein PHLGIDRAFT_30130 [Phlebiopsis gigantea 11061_1 CR5-6]